MKRALVEIYASSSSEDDNEETSVIEEKTVELAKSNKKQYVVYFGLSFIPIFDSDFVVFP